MTCPCRKTEQQIVVEPIRRSLEYQAVGRKLLLVDELPQGALARYERDVAAIAHVISRRGAVPDQIQEGEEILVPTFEIATNPTVRLSEIKARRFNDIELSINPAICWKLLKLLLRKTPPHSFS